MRFQSMQAGARVAKTVYEQLDLGPKVAENRKHIWGMRKKPVRREANLRCRDRVSNYCAKNSTYLRAQVSRATQVLEDDTQSLPSRARYMARKSRVPVQLHKPSVTGSPAPYLQSKAERWKMIKSGIQITKSVNWTHRTCLARLRCCLRASSQLP